MYGKLIFNRVVLTTTAYLTVKALNSEPAQKLGKKIVSKFKDLKKPHVKNPDFDPETGEIK